MSVVIVGGNECMIRRYKNLCAEYHCKAKIYPKLANGLKNVGAPDLLILFTSTMSHKMLYQATGQAKKRNIRIARSHTSSMSALKNILENHVKGCVRDA